jgi:hypothetical protein
VCCELSKAWNSRSRTRSLFGSTAKEKLTNPGATGQPEDQLRAPFERLLTDLAEISKLDKGTVTAVGESSQGELKTRPDYAVTVQNTLVGFVELKAPGKGAMNPGGGLSLYRRQSWVPFRAHRIDDYGDVSQLV